MLKKVLIICYSFPPFPGVGGRRWAKFAKHLSGKGYEVNVISSENPFDEKSQWCNDIENTNIKTYRLPVNYPGVMLHGTRNIFEKIIYRWWRLYFKIYSKGVTFERTFFWKKQLLEKASQLIESEKIRTVIVTIPPYRLALYSLELKKMFPQIRLIIDFRDPWTDNKSYHGFKNMSKKRFEYELKLETKVLNGCDKIISVSEQMTKEFISRKINPDKIHTIPNGYDPSDILEGNTRIHLKSDKIRLVYAGSLYNDLDYVIDPLVKYLGRLKNDNPAVFSRISIEFYGNLNKEMKDKLHSMEGQCISIHNPVPLHEMQAILGEASFCVLITPPDYSVVFNTKFCEYLANHKPVLLFAYPSDATGFLMANKLGYYINPCDIEKGLSYFFEHMNEIIADFNVGFNLEPFSVPYLTSEIEKLIV